MVESLYSIPCFRHISYNECISLSALITFFRIFQNPELLHFIKLIYWIMNEINFPTKRIIFAVEPSFLYGQVNVLITCEVRTHPLNYVDCLPDIKERDSIFINSSQKVDTASIVEFWIDFQKPFLVIDFDCFSLPNVLIIPLASLLFNLVDKFLTLIFNVSKRISVSESLFDSVQKSPIV